MGVRLLLIVLTCLRTSIKASLVILVIYACIIIRPYYVYNNRLTFVRPYLYIMLKFLMFKMGLTINIFNI